MFEESYKYRNLGEAGSKGFTLIELLLVIAIIGILAAIAVPGYLGMQEKSRKSVLLRSVTSSVPEIQVWMQSSRGLNQGLVEIDTNASGSVGDGDLTNAALMAMGVEIAYVAARATYGEVSPWDGSQPMWYTVDPLATNDYGYIVLSSTTYGLRIRAYAKGDTSPIADRLIFAD